jgi:hypothetical protein
MGNTSVREYAVFVRILSPPKQLIPGMNASVTIQTEYQSDVLQAPLQCVYSANDTTFVLRQTGVNRFETVQVEIAGENTQNVWIGSGADEGDMLVMDPGQYKHLMDLPALQQESRIELPEGTELTSAPAPAGGPPGDAPIDGAGDSAMGQQVAQGDGPRGGGRRGGEGRGGPGGGDGEGRGDRGPGGFSPDDIIKGIMEQYDTNGDGKLDATEQEGFDERTQRIAEADANKDGELTEKEIRTAMQAMMRRMREAGFGGEATGGAN